MCAYIRFCACVCHTCVCTYTLTFLHAHIGIVQKCNNDKESINTTKEMLSYRVHYAIKLECNYKNIAKKEHLSGNYKTCYQIEFLL